MPKRTFLDISTEHLTSEDSDLLSKFGVVDGERVQLEGCRLIVDPYPYGWRVDAFTYEGQEDRAEFLTELRKSGFSDVFIAILTKADAAGHSHIGFDRDGEMDPDYPEPKDLAEAKVYLEGLISAVPARAAP